MTNEEARDLAEASWSKGWVSYHSDCYTVWCKPHEQGGVHQNHYRVSGRRGGPGSFSGNSWEECFELAKKDEEAWELQKIKNREDKKKVRI